MGNKIYVNATNLELAIKVKEGDLYSAFIEVHSKRSGTDHTVLPENYTVPASTS